MDYSYIPYTHHFGQEKNVKFTKMEQIPYSIRPTSTDCRVEAYEVDVGCKNTPFIVMLHFKPSITELNSFIVLYIMEEGFHPGKSIEWVPCKMMNGIWFNLAMAPKSIGTNYVMDSTGKVMGIEGGGLSYSDIGHIVHQMLCMYERWSKFPIEQSWEAVLDLCHAQAAVDTLNKEIREHCIRKNIEKSRKEIAYLQEQIARMEADLTCVYEEGAEGLNVLERNGYNAYLEEERDDYDKRTEEVA